jgi:hypothetical protein
LFFAQVFLQHLGPLSSLPTFTALWLTILDLINHFVDTAASDLLADALPESLKNMLLVMDTSGRNLFFSGPVWAAGATACATAGATAVATAVFSSLQNFSISTEHHCFGSSALRCVALRCVALRCVALRCVALRCVG